MSMHWSTSGVSMYSQAPKLGVDGEALLVGLGGSRLLVAPSLVFTAPVARVAGGCGHVVRIIGNGSPALDNYFCQASEMGEVLNF